MNIKYFLKLMLQTLLTMILLYTAVGFFIWLTLYILGWCGVISTAYGLGTLIVWCVCLFISTACYLHTKNKDIDAKN